MEMPSPAIDDEPQANLPLRIVVSEAGKTAALKALVGQCLPMLTHPERFAPARRAELAVRLTRALGASKQAQEDDIAPECDEPYEPGMWLEEPEA